MAAKKISRIWAVTPLCWGRVYVDASGGREVRGRRINVAQTALHLGAPVVLERVERAARDARPPARCATRRGSALSVYEGRGWCGARVGRGDGGGDDRWPKQQSMESSYDWQW